MLTLEEARRRILDLILPLDAERIGLRVGTGRYLAQGAVAPGDLPPFDNSAMDGYAVMAADLASASLSAPVVLEQQGRIPAGETSSRPLARGACARVFTGSALPPGADAVVMQEETEPVPGQAGQVRFLSAVRRWENIRFKGEDVRAGTEVLRAGQRLSPSMIGLLASLGLGEVKVHRRPVVGLVATGNELEEPGQPPAPGKVFESNRLCLAAWLERCGAVPKVLPVVADQLPAIKGALRQALAGSDAVITTGGVSVGELDLVQQAFAELGGQTDFWKVQIKPGKPFCFGRWHDQFLFGLPGNPVSALVTFLLLVRPALLRWQGASRWELPAQPGTLLEPMENPGDRPHFFRVRLDASGGVCSAGTQASHVQSALAAADGLVEVPPATCLGAGSQVTVLRLEF